MARINSLTNFLDDVATAIKQKTGDNTPIPASEFDTEILSIEAAGTYQQKILTITQNGITTLTPDTGFDAMDQVVITVNVPINQLQSKTVSVTSNGNVTLLPDTNYDGFSEVSLQVNVPSGSGDVKLFETEQAMQADPNPSEGDLAVVYGDETTNWDGQSEVTGFTFPSTVTLSSGVTGRCMGVADTMQIEGQVNSSNAYFYIDDWESGIMFNTEYESQDGLTYTRTDSGEESISFENPITFRMWNWSDVCGNFMKIGGNYFEGLYEYGTNTDINISCLGIKFSDLYPTYNQNVLYQYNSNLTDLARLNEDDVYVWTSMVFKIQAESNLYYGQTLYKPIEGYSPLNNTNVLIGQMIENNTNYIIAYMTNSPVNETLLHYTGSGFETVNILANEWQSFTVNSSTYYYKILATINPTEWVANYKYSLFSMGNSGSSRPKTFVKTGSTATTTSGDYSVIPTYGTSTRYFYAPTQLTLSNPNQLLPDIAGYGKNGVVTGDNSIYDNLDQSQVLQNIYNLIPSQIDFYTGINKDTDLLLTTRPWASNSVPEKFKTYKLLPLREITDGENPDVILFPKDDLIIQPNELRDIINETDLNVSYNSDYLLSNSEIYFSSDRNYLLMYNKQYNSVWIIDVVNKTLITNFGAFNIYGYKHRFYYNKNGWTSSITSPDYNIYVYDLDTRTETIVTTIPAIASNVQPYSVAVTGNDNLLCYSYFSRRTTGSGSYYNEECQPVFIDMDTNTAQVPTKITHTQTNNDTGLHYLIVTPNSIIAVVVYYMGSTIGRKYYYTECTKDLTVTKLLNGATPTGSTMFYADYGDTPLYAIKNGNILNILGNSFGSYYTITINSSTSITVNSTVLSDSPKFYLTKGGIPFIRLNSNSYYYSLLTGIDTTQTMPLILDTTKRIYRTMDTFKVDGISSGGISMGYLTNYSFFGWIDTSTMEYLEVHGKILHIARSKPVYLKVDYTSEYDVLAMNIGTPDATRLIPLNNFTNNSEPDLHVSTVHLEGWTDPSTEEETDVWYLGGSEDIDFPTYLTTLHAYNRDGVDITDSVKWEVQITNNGTISNISDNVNFGMDSHNNISFLPAANVPFILVDDWFEFRVKCTDVYGNIVYSNELEIENSTAPDDE